MGQEAYSFDRETVVKIGRGALIAVSGAAAIALLEYLGTVEMSNPMLVSVVAWVVPVAVNTIKEWMRGK